MGTAKLPPLRSRLGWAICLTLAACASELRPKSTDLGASPGLEVVPECITPADCPASRIELPPCLRATCRAGRCSVEVDPSGTPCDDGRLCTEGDVCLGDSCVGLPLPCEDGSSCTTDTCSDELRCARAERPGCCRRQGECAADGPCTEGVCIGDTCRVVPLPLDECCREATWFWASFESGAEGFTVERDGEGRWATPPLAVPASGTPVLRFLLTLENRWSTLDEVTGLPAGWAAFPDRLHEAWLASGVEEATLQEADGTPWIKEQALFVRVVDLDTSGAIPPTNVWYSGLVRGATEGRIPVAVDLRLWAGRLVRIEWVAATYVPGDAGPESVEIDNIRLETTCLPPPECFGSQDCPPAGAERRRTCKAGACGAELDPTMLIFEADFETTGEASMDLGEGCDKSWGRVCWHRSVRRAHGGAHSARYGDPGAGHYDSGVPGVGSMFSSPALELPHGPSEVSLWLWHDTELGSCPVEQLHVELGRATLASTVEGIPFTAPPGRTEDEPGTSLPRRTWLHVVLPVPEALWGESARLGIWFSSYDGLLNSGEGVFVDDIRVTPAP